MVFRMTSYINLFVLSFFTRKTLWTLLFPFREKPFLTLIFSKFNPLNSDTSFLRTLAMAPFVSVLTGLA